MMKLYRKNELLFAILCIVIYVVVGANLRSIGDDSPIMTIGLTIMSLLLFLFIKGYGLMEKYGLSGWARNSKQMLYFIPLWIVASGNLWGGIEPHYQGLGLVCAIASFAMVGFVEEVLFRGFLFRAMLADGDTKTAIAISSITFGIGHIVNLLNGQASLETLSQVAFAITVGFLFTFSYYKGGSLLPVIAAHSIIDVFSVFAVDKGPALHWAYLISTLVITVLYCVYISHIETPASNTAAKE